VHIHSYNREFVKLVCEVQKWRRHKEQGTKTVASSISFGTTPKGSRKHLGAVVLGTSTNGKLLDYGYAGSGFSEKGLKDAVGRMKPLFTDRSPADSNINHGDWDNNRQGIAIANFSYSLPLSQ
jgi:hypothetical protein